jgi:hypothetical protein
MGEEDGCCRRGVRRDQLVFRVLALICIYLFIRLVTIMYFMCTFVLNSTVSGDPCIVSDFRADMSTTGSPSFAYIQSSQSFQIDKVYISSSCLCILLL